MDIYNKFIGKFGDTNIRQNELMKDHTYFKVGGQAKVYFEPKNNDEFVNAVQFCIKEKIPYVVIGGGANVIFSDLGFWGVVIKNKVEEIKTVGVKSIKTEDNLENDAYVQVTAGTTMTKLARYTIEESLEGLEFLISVPGTVGGGLKINSHFQPEKEQFIGNTLYQAILIDGSGNLKTVDHEYFKFGYDLSILQKTAEIVVSAIFRLKRVDDKKLLWEKVNAYIAYRNANQPLGTPSSGCIFRNISKENAVRLATPNLTTSTGYLIEKAGLAGVQIGDVKISDRHSNYFLNQGKATAADIYKLINHVKSQIKQKFNVDLETEVFLIGEFNGKI